MYHDQALVPFKTLAFEEGVNVTLGLPFVRTSPDHGTAFDIAGTGKANPVAAILSAALMLDYLGHTEAAARVEAAAFDGAQAIDLAGSPGAGMLETTFATTPGMAYELVFHYARNAFLGAETGDAEVDVVGAGSLLEATIQHDPALYEFDVYLEFSALFTADSTEAILRFTSLDTGNTGITLDGICISAVPSVGVGEAIRPAPWSRVKAAFRD